MLREHIVGAHHFVVFVFEDVAVPDIAAGESLKPHDDARHHSRIGAHGVFPSGFARLRRHCGADVAHLALRRINLRFEGPAVEYLESNQMKMDGMRVVGKVEEVPDLDGVEVGFSVTGMFQ